MGFSGEPLKLSWEVHISVASSDKETSSGLMRIGFSFKPSIPVTGDRR
jgi:hypothetical protein